MYACVVGLSSPIVDVLIGLGSLELQITWHANYQEPGHPGTFFSFYGYLKLCLYLESTYKVSTVSDVGLIHNIFFLFRFLCLCRKLIEWRVE